MKQNKNKANLLLTLRQDANTNVTFQEFEQIRMNFLVLQLSCLSVYFFKARPIRPLFTPSHSTLYRHIYLQTSKHIFMFWCSLMEMWTINVSEERGWSLYVPQLPVSLMETLICTPLKERGYGTTFFSVSFIIDCHLYFQTNMENAYRHNSFAPKQPLY